MSYIIDRNHPVYTLSSIIQEICDLFFKAYNFSYFQYLRCYPDGSISILINRTDLFESFVQHNYPTLSSIDNQTMLKQNYFFFWDEALPTVPVTMAREQHQLYHGMTWVRRYKNHYDMIGFAMPAEKRNIHAFYLNHHSILKQFVDDFEHQTHHLQKLVEKNKIYPPPYLHDANCQKLCLPNNRKKIYISTQDINTHLTNQEFFTLQLLSEDKSFKEIAQILDISHRTTETYIDRIRVRTGINNQRDLIKLLHFVRS
jgi:DNA-binding CsgD family transcriptional regulator